MEKFKKNFQVPYYESNILGELLPVQLLKYLGETSEAHSQYLNMGIDELKNNNYSWVLYKWKLKIDEYPSVNDNIIIETWTSDFHKFYAYREFIIYASNMQELGRARSLWILLDLEKKRPIRIPKQFNKDYNIIDERVFEEFWDIKEEIKAKDYLDFHVRKSDIDYNNHVNNSNYLEWIIEVVPEDVYKDYQLRELEITYKKETVYGETILSEIDDNNSNELIIYNHRIVNKESKEKKAIAKTIWKKRQ